MEKPLVTIHEYTEQGTNGDFLLVSKLILKTTPTFALEKQMRLEWKQTRFILTLPVASAVHVHVHVAENYQICSWILNFHSPKIS